MNRFIGRRLRRAAIALALVVLATGAPATPGALAADTDPGRTDWVTDPSWYAGQATWNTVYGLSDDGRFVLASMAYVDAWVGPAGGLAVRDMLTGDVHPIADDYFSTTPPTESDPILSADGSSVVYWSQSPGLDPTQPETPGDGDFDLYVTNWVTGVTRRASVPAPSKEEDFGSSWSKPSVSADGRYVLYTIARPTVTDRGISDTGGYDQLYRYDAVTGLNTVVATPEGGTTLIAGEGGMSRDGRYVVYVASPKPANSSDTPAASLFEKDMVTGRVWRIAPGNRPVVSDDGSVVVFDVWDAHPATGLADTNQNTDLIRWTRHDNRLELITKSSDGLAAAGGWSHGQSLSADGSTVVFLTSAKNLMAGIADPNNPTGIPYYDQQSEDAYAWRNGTVHLISRAAGKNSTGNSGASEARVSADGRSAVFVSRATDLVAGYADRNDAEPCRNDVFHHSIVTGETRPVSVIDDAGDYGLAGCSDKAYVNGDGSLVAFNWQEHFVYGGRHGTLVARRALDPARTPPPPPSVPGDDGIDPGPIGTGDAPADVASGYWALAGDGTVYAFGAAPAHTGPAAGTAVDIEPVAGGGYLVLGTNGAVTARGGARALGGVPAGALRSGEQATSLSSVPDGSGYWIFTSAGRVLPFGTARSFGDLAATRLNGPVLDSVATPTGNGYFMVGSDGGVFAFGDARFAGSTGHLRLNAPVRSLVPDADGTGYWLVASDGGIFAFDAPFRGSMGHTPLNRPVRGMVRYGNGYLMVAEDGGIFTFSNRPFSGSLASSPPATPVVSIAAYVP